MGMLKAKTEKENILQKCYSFLGSNEGYSLWTSRHSKSEQGTNPRERQKGMSGKEKRYFYDLGVSGG